MNANPIDIPYCYGPKPEAFLAPAPGEGARLIAYTNLFKLEYERLPGVEFVVPAMFVFSEFMGPAGVPDLWPLHRFALN